LTAYHDQFPYSYEQRSWQELSLERLLERQEAIKIYADENKCEWVIAQKLTKEASALCWHPLEYVKISEFSDLQFDWWRAENSNRRLYIPEHNYWVSCPRVPSSDKTSNATMFLPKKYMVLLSPNQESPETTLSFKCGLPANRLTRSANHGLLRLMTDLHEMRHLAQASESILYSDRNAMLNNDYLKEFDSDSFAFSIFCNQLPEFNCDPTDILKVGLFSRYANMLSGCPVHDVAPALEQRENGTFLASCYDIETEIINIAATMFRLEYGREPSKEDDLMTPERIRQEPQIIYSLLRRCLEDGDFDQHSFSKYIANRILEAVEYFCEGLTREPSVVNKTYPARQGLVSNLG
jgi:hypothetical protein